MRALVLFDSQYGNTERVARAIARGLEPHGVVRVSSVARQGTASLEADLLVVGSPTQVHGMGRHELHHLLEHLTAEALDGVSAAAFDTRVHGPVGLTGSAATGLAKRLRARGARLIVPVESFIVEGREGPLVDGEEQRAEAWAEAIARAYLP
ncbi:MAG: flavodoxin family protein, partial [Deinococcales bacterium]